VTLLAATFLAFGMADLVRDHSGEGWLRTALSVAAAVLVACGVARLAGLAWSTVAIVGAAETVVLILWVTIDARVQKQPTPAVVALLVVVGAPLIAFAASGSVPGVDGELQNWFSRLPVRHAEDPSAPGQVLVALTAGVFLLASANRIVRLVLVVARTPTRRAETRLRGGRLIGPMERLFIVAMLVAGEPGGIAIIIAAKGLLRLPEIQKSTKTSAADELTEYFLIGTLSSLLIAVACGGAILAIS
jgi:hypothetical protein